MTSAAALALLGAGPAGAQDDAGQATASRVSLGEAVRAAEQALGGRAVEAEIDVEDGAPVFEVEVLVGEDMHEALVDAETGEVRSTSRERLATVWGDWFQQDRLDAVNDAPRSLGAILADLESETGAVAREAELEDEDGQLYYEIEMSGADGEETETYVDVSTGERLSGEPDD